MSKIAVIQTAFPGDVILSTPIFESLYSVGHQVVAVVRSQAETLVRYNEFLERVIIHDKKGGLVAFLKTVSDLKRENCDIALVVQKHLRSALLALYAGIPRRIGYKIACGHSLYTDEAPFDRTVHAVHRALELCRGLSPVQGFTPKIFIEKKTREDRWDFLKAQGIDPEKYMVLAPGSIWATKRWPFYARLAELLGEAFRSDIVLIGSKDDQALCEDIAVKSKWPVKNLAGATDLLLSTVIIEGAKLVVANDSAPAHIAAAVDTPLVAIFGPTVTSFGFAPFSDSSAVVENVGLYCRPCSPHGPQKCPEGHFRCMKEVTPERVLEKCKEILAEG